ncbi:VPA1262 family N-terminal domain-containing protein [Raoultella ornithinolytica]|uniref:VPA1262 family N-terminal domain-containing protein n=1 Tax=Raoultella ornithinolytica TaxID=54291 RepID=UPI0015DC6BA1|nr:VPA1262 family N-terminal domain-containing protein [Raoultella ornithinolytica]BBQ88085.1 hypothetical protein WP3W18E06_12130 [Raoultella ornithinolytica]
MQTKISEIKLALQDGVLGFYNRIEVTEIFSLSPNKTPCNILTLMVAESLNEPIDTKEIYLTKELISINNLKNWRFGIKKYHLSIDDLILRLDVLNQNRKWNDYQTEITHLKKIDKYFISADSYELVPINNILKNNFNNGSYIFEWFDFSKENHKELLSSPQALQALSDIVNKIIPISIASVSDRVGNFLLQIPIRVIMAKFGLEEQNQTYTLKCDLDWHEDAQKRDLIINCHLSENDRICEGYYTTILKSGDLTISLPIPNKRSHIGTIWDPKYNFILSRTRPSAFISPTARITTSVSTYQERILTNGIESKKISILKPDNNKKKLNSSNFVVNWVDKRIYDSSSIQLRESRNFVQYNSKGSNKLQSKYKALDDLIYLINTYGQDAVWLWDPYLSFQDLFDTLLLNRHSGSSMRAISSLELPPNLNKGVPLQDNYESKAIQTINKYKESFNALPSETIKSINLEFRCRIGNNGWDFHDRFIIFPATNYHSSTTAWSLGTSVNSFGTSHHILQKVHDAQLIANAFSELWDSLESTDCLVWRNIND